MVKRTSLANAISAARSDWTERGGGGADACLQLPKEYGQRHSRLVSSAIIMLIGTSEMPTDSIVWTTPLSRSSKSSAVRSANGFPPSTTRTSTRTASTPARNCAVCMCGKRDQHSQWPPSLPYLDAKKIESAWQGLRRSVHTPRTVPGLPRSSAGPVRRAHSWPRPLGRSGSGARKEQAAPTGRRRRTPGRRDTASRRRRSGPSRSSSDPRKSAAR